MENAMLKTILVISVIDFICAVVPTTLIAQTGISFTEILDKNNFFPGQKNVMYSVSLNGMPDLPFWLKLHQQDPFSDAILHGTPSVTDIETVKLEVIAWNKENYETLRKVILISIINFDAASVRHQLEFRITNKDIYDLFAEKSKFLAEITKLWPSANFVTVLQKPSDRSRGSYPLPGEKEGVFVTVGGRTVVPPSLKQVISNCSLDSNVKSMFLKAGYNVDWCALKERTVDVENINKGFGDENFQDLDKFDSTTLNTREYQKQGENLTLDIVYVFVPVILGVAFMVVLTCVMCFKTDTTKRKNPKKGQVALARSSDVKDNGNGFAYGQLDEDLTDSRSGTPSRLKNDKNGSSNPPPYRVPPKREKTQDSSF